MTRYRYLTLIDAEDDNLRRKDERLQNRGATAGEASLQFARSCLCPYLEHAGALGVAEGAGDIAAVEMKTHRFFIQPWRGIDDARGGHPGAARDAEPAESGDAGIEGALRFFVVAEAQRSLSAKQLQIR
jgi:hypothetical protein